VVVFVTAHEEYAIRAFEVHALDYLVKPFGLERFRQAFRRARAAVEERGGAFRGERVQALLEELREEQRGLERLLSGPAPYLERLMVKVRDRVLLLPVDEIDRVEAEGNYVRLHAGKEQYLVRWKIGALEALGDARTPVVVFVTAHEEYAIRAFEVHALDYLVKPFGLERFRQAFRRARAAVEERGGAFRGERVQALLEELREEQRGLERLLSAPAPYLERLMVKVRDRVLLLPVDDIDRVEAEGNYVRLHAGKEQYLVRWKIGALEARLDPRRFVRIHRSALVNLDRVRELRPWFAGDYLVVMKDGTELKLSRGYRAKLEERMGGGG